MAADSIAYWLLVAIVSMFCDEIGPDPARQIEVVRELGVGCIDLRSAWDTDVLHLDRQRVRELRTRFADAGIRVACLATRIAKRTGVDDPELTNDLARAFDLAEFFGVGFVRVFGFRMESDGRSTVSAATERLAAAADGARGRKITLLLETERGLVVDGPEKALEVLRAVDDPALRYIWDPGNLVDLAISNPTDSWFERLAPYVAYVRVKDGRLGSAATCYAGAGDGQIGELLTRLRARSYGGVVSVEPKVMRLAEFGGDRASAVAGAVRALLALMRSEATAGRLS